MYRFQTIYTSSRKGEPTKANLRAIKGESSESNLETEGWSSSRDWRSQSWRSFKCSCIADCVPATVMDGSASS